ncbi:MAG: VRR-NUC domain-containing protein [Gammaproteobacteria bacterium]|nr:VRR-NUC domain-containing protein [Gammaproteobacteria bacterium]
MPAADYYLDNLEQLLDWVERHHWGLVDDGGRAFLFRFRALPRPARRLYVRLLMRRGPWFRLDRLTYQEVESTGTAVLALCLSGLARLAGPQGWLDRLQLLRVPELRDLVLQLAPQRACGRQRRAEWLEACTELWPFEEKLLPQAVALEPTENLDLLRLLYFGNHQQDLVEFILADLGILRFEPVPMEPALPWRCAAEVRRDLRCHQWAGQVSAWIEAGGADLDEKALAAADTVLRTAACASATERRRNRALLRLATLWQMQGRQDRALAALASASGPPAREKRIRMLVQDGGPEAASAALHTLGAQASDPAERRFIERFDPVRGRCRPAPRSDGIARGRIHLIRHDPESRIEEVVAGVLRSGGCQVLHRESALIGLLFGLAFWDVIFSPRAGAFVQPFQSGPLDLFEPEFARRRSAAISKRLAALASGEFGSPEMLEVWHRKRGTVNALVAWSRFSSGEVRQICEVLPPRVKARLCAIALEEPALLRRGFPDLLLLGGMPGRYQFIEVKGPGDVLRPEQRLWLHALAEHDLTARVLEVRWA